MMNPELLRRLLERQQAQTLPELDLTAPSPSRLREDDYAEPEPVTAQAPSPPPTAPPLVGGEDEMQRLLREHLMRRMREEAEGPTGAQRAGAFLTALGGQPQLAREMLAPRSSVAPQVAEYLARQQALQPKPEDELEAATRRARLEELLGKPAERQQAAERQAREDAYRREHDAAVLRQQAENAAATRALAAKGLGLREAGVEAAKNKDVVSVEDRVRNINRSLDQLEDLVKEHGTMELTGPVNELLEGAITSYATDMAKLRDPTSVAREGEVELEKKAMFKPGFRSLATSNETALDLIRQARKNVAARRDVAYQVRGMSPPAAAPSQATPDGLVEVVSVATGKVLRMTPELAERAVAAGKARRP